MKLSYPGALDGYGDLRVSFGNDHLQNVVDLIYSARLQGVERIELRIDDGYAWRLVLEHYYLFKYLPEAEVCRDAVDDVAVLHVRFRHGRNTRTWNVTAEQELASMSEEDIDRMFAQIEREEAHPDFGKISNSLLQDRFYTVQLPQWILAKYKSLRN